MTVISKQLFYEKIGNELNCHHIHVWNESCFKANFWVSYQVFIGGLKFFLPIYVMKAIIHRKRLKHKAFLKKIVIEEFRSALYAVFLCLPVLVYNCAAYKITGRLHYYNVGLVSGIFSGLGLLLETKENKLLDTLIFFNLLVEAAFKNMHHFNMLRLTNTRETVIFMIVSSALMYVLQNRSKDYKFTNFWFYTPAQFVNRQHTNEDRAELTAHICHHEGTCTEYAIKGLQNYFVLGCGFSIIKRIIPKMLAVFRKPQLIVPIIISKDNIKFGAFIGSYVAIYRYITCWLLRKPYINPEYIGAIAGLLSGATYSISPNLQVLCVGITTFLQVGFNHVLERYKVKKDIPQQLVYMMSHCLLLHNAIMSKQTCPSYYLNMLDVATNSMFPTIYSSLIGKHILGTC